MEDLQEKLGAVLSDPQTMQKIMALAQQLGGQERSDPPKGQDAPESGAPLGLDPSMLQKLAGLAGQGTIDRNQQGLLNALGPYLSRQRLQKLERAMRAARMAGMATNLLGISGSQGR